jgi:hypothetical protein
VKNGRTIGEVIEELETDRDRLRALCEELGGALTKVANDMSKWHGDGISPDEWKLNEWEQIARAALKKAEQAPKP